MREGEEKDDVVTVRDTRLQQGRPNAEILRQAVEWEGKRGGARIVVGHQVPAKRERNVTMIEMRPRRVNSVADKINSIQLLLCLGMPTLKTPKLLFAYVDISYFNSTIL